MAIFSRRTIQQLINENAKFISERQTRDHVRKLNESYESYLKGDSFLQTEWEVVLLNAFHIAFSNIGTIKHEPALGCKPDIYFHSFSNLDDNFIADVTTVSDKGLDGQNAVKKFYDRLVDTFREKGLLETGSCHLKIESDWKGVSRGGKKLALKMPALFEFDQSVSDEQFFKNLDELSKSPTGQFLEFLNEISISPTRRHHHSVKNEIRNADFMIYYVPKGVSPRPPSIDHLDYTTASKLSDNPVFNALKRKYDDQLSKTNFRGVKGIVLCDGGSRLLHRHSSSAGYTVDEVIEHFLDTYLTINFVLLFRVDERHDSLNMFTKIYEGAGFKTLSQPVAKAFIQLSNLLPPPYCTARNAGNFLRTGRQNGTVKEGGNEIRISARGILNVLSGKATPGRLFKLFSSMLDQGRLITEITIDRDGIEDDEWMTIKFGRPDPAVSPYVMPQREKSVSKRIVMNKRGVK